MAPPHNKIHIYSEGNNSEIDQPGPSEPKKQKTQIESPLEAEEAEETLNPGTPQVAATPAAPPLTSSTTEMAQLTGTGKEMASGGASSDGLMEYEIERPLSIFSGRINTYKKVHKFMTFGLADVIISPTPLTEGNKYLTSYLAEVPWHIPALYMNQSEFDLLQPGSRCIEVSIEVYYRGSTIQFQTAASTTELATLNQINDIAVANALNKTGWGSNVSYTSFDATQPMIPTGITRPKYAPIAGNYRGMVRDFYGSNNDNAQFTGDIPKHQTSRQTFLYNYWATSARGIATPVNTFSQQYGGWPCIAEKTHQMDGKTVVNQCVMQSVYQPKLAPLKAPLIAQAHGLPMSFTNATVPVVTLNVPTGGHLPVNRNAVVTDGTGVASATGLQQRVAEAVTPMGNTATTELPPTFNIYTPIEKSQLARSGFWGQNDPHVQPSIHIGVQPVPALSTTALLSEDNQFNQWTDTRAYWEVVATMKTKEQNPTAYPYAINANVPMGEVILWNTTANQPAVNKNPRDDGATFAGLYTNLPAPLPSAP